MIINAMLTLFGDIECFAANTGFLLDIAPKFKALLVFIEILWGINAIWEDSYKSAETLGYLNSQQALADDAVLIRSLKQNLSSDSSPFVVFGGSYGGRVSKLSQVFAGASLCYNYPQTEKCFMIEDAADPHGLDGWRWQTCTEMVMPMTCSNNSMFPPSGYDYKDFAEQCMMTYGVRPRIHWITTEFGGKRIELVLKRFGSNIIFSNGMQDPWSRGGVLKNISASIIALVTKKGAHHVDFRSKTKDDPDWLVELRRQEVEIIQKWVG
ncbi:alpha/beta-Hydrolases superfamily protein [Citrus sinensis]|nr:alpha/beta-Hydrolases superfamily protein [Citrus sinensis]